jgi:hypothetical protein
MRRRDLVTLLGVGAVRPLAVCAQQFERMRRIAVLHDYADGDPEGRSQIAAFREELQKLGWAEGDDRSFNHPVVQRIGEQRGASEPWSHPSGEIRRLQDRFANPADFAVSVPYWCAQRGGAAPTESPPKKAPASRAP